MRFDVLTLFPAMFEGPLDESILKRAQNAGLIEIAIHQLRDWATDKHHTVDDTAFGGGPGMVMKPEPLFAAVEDIQLRAQQPAHVILLTPQGRRLDAPLVRELATYDRLLLVCGRYEGVDERVREHLADHEISIGDFVVSGGELPALLLLDAVSRQLPGVLGAEDALAEESFDDDLLEYPQYTRPADFRGWSAPDILRSGNHAEVDRWRRRQRILRTSRRRPDLFAIAHLTEEELTWLAQQTDE
jgi:tRNA (guanine37-N1)-methyltransferase